MDDQLILSVLSKLGPDYSVFVSTFYSTKSALGATWKMPSLDSFVTDLTREQDKLIQMGALKSSKPEALIAGNGKPQASMNNKEKKQTKKDKEKKKEQKIESSKNNTITSSNNGKPKREKVKCAYCKKNGHDEHKCMKKQIDHLSHLLEKNNIGVPDSIKQSSSSQDSSKGKDTKDKGKGKALVAVASSSSSPSWVIDSGASHHMGSS